MANKPIVFADLIKECKFRTYQDQKCINEKNKFMHLVHSCFESLCPILKESEVKKPEELKEEKKEDK